MLYLPHHCTMMFHSRTSSHLLQATRVHLQRSSTNHHRRQQQLLTSTVKVLDPRVTSEKRTASVVGGSAASNALWLAASGVVFFGFMSVVPIEYMFSVSRWHGSNNSQQLLFLCARRPLSNGMRKLLGADESPYMCIWAFSYCAGVQSRAESGCKVTFLALILLMKNSQLLFRCCKHNFLG